MRKRKKLLHIKFINSNSYLHESRYKRHKNKLTSILRHSGKQSLCELINKHRQNTHETWKIFNASHIKKPNSDVLKDKSIDSNIACCHHGIADDFEYFLLILVPI